MKAMAVLPFALLAGILIMGAVADKADENSPKYAKDIVESTEGNDDKLVEFLKKYGEKNSDGVKKVQTFVDENTKETEKWGFIKVPNIQDIKAKATDKIDESLEELQKKFRNLIDKFSSDTDNVFAEMKSKLGDSTGKFDLSNGHKAQKGVNLKINLGERASGFGSTLGEKPNEMKYKLGDKTSGMKNKIQEVIYNINFPINLVIETIN